MASWLAQVPRKKPPCSLWAPGIIIFNQSSFQEDDFPGGRKAFFCPRYRMQKQREGRRKFPVEDKVIGTERIQIWY